MEKMMKKILAVSFLFCFLAMFIKFYIFGESSSLMFEQLSLGNKFLMVSGVMGGIGFWLMMLIDMLQNNALRHRVVWVLSLIFLSWLAALVYFMVHFINHDVTKNTSKG